VKKSVFETAGSHTPYQGNEHDRVILRDAHTGHWLDFSQPQRVISTHKVEEVAACLREVELLVTTQRWAAAGFMAYEAAPAFDTALLVQEDNSFPLLWFGLYLPPCPIDLPEPAPPQPDLHWTPSVDDGAYTATIQRIQDYIAAGDTYQVNYTYRLRTPFSGDAWPLFTGLVAAHQPEYGGYIQTLDWTILSLSPELFFQLKGNHIQSLPMKGTIGRALTAADDLTQGVRLQNSSKDQAENVMIVDMVRNDLARIALPGSVQVDNLFAVQRYPTLWQMVSPVHARTMASFCEILSALFPAASITGAPKARTMAIIKELETSPRRIYTGAIGFLLPDRRAQFNVAIRTLLIDRQNEVAEYGVGGGITADSTAVAELEETRLKSLLCRTRLPDFSLLETLLWTPDEGYALLPEHVRRLTASADYFSYPCDLTKTLDQLDAATAGYNGIRQKIRLLLDRRGELRIETVPFAPPDTRQPVRVMLAPHPIEDQNVFFYHKTTHRAHYDRMREGLPQGVADVLLYNHNGEVTETTIANIVVTIKDRQYTPPVRCGLLAGTYRQHLLDTGKLVERVLTLEELRSLNDFTLINSVRGCYPAILVPHR
jgi:para-aminobenzoate synthetase/4-amino-4-deoxychorismate lyase